MPALKQLIEVYSRTNGGSVVGLENVPRKDVHKYGVVKIKENYKNFISISKLIEKPKVSEAPSNLTVVGRYILNSKVLNYLSLQKRGYGNEIQLTDSLMKLVLKPGLFGIEFNGKRFDCGSKFGFIEANVNFGLNDKEIRSSLKGMLRKL